MITSALIHPQNITEKALENRNNKNDNFIFVIIFMGGLKHVWSFLAGVSSMHDPFKHLLKRIPNAQNPS